MVLTLDEQLEGYQYYTVVEKVTQNYIYEVKAKSKREAELMVKDGKAGTAKSTNEGITRYETYG